MGIDHGERIARFRTMTEADPSNELGHFSLARAYLEAGLYAEAVPALKRVIEINPGFSKAYALLGQAYRQLNDMPAAAEILTTGYTVAHQRGDLMPRNEMAQALVEMGVTVPEAKAPVLTAEQAAAGQIICKRCSRAAPKMPEPPFSGEQGAYIQASVCGPCFKEWVGQGTKVINELRLNLTEKSAQDVYDQHMKEFLNI